MMICLNYTIFDNFCFSNTLDGRYINIIIVYNFMYIEYRYNKLFNGATSKCCTCLSIGFSMQRALTVSEYIVPTELGCLASFRSGNLMSLVLVSKSSMFLEAINMLLGAIDSMDISI